MVQPVKPKRRRKSAKRVAPARPTKEQQEAKTRIRRVPPKKG
jgi:hypothetical protein